MKLLKENYSYLFDHLLPPVIDPSTSTVIDLNEQKTILNDSQLEAAQEFLSQLRLLSIKDNQLKQKKGSQTQIFAYDIPIHPCFTDYFEILSSGNFSAFLYSITLTSHFTQLPQKVSVGIALASPLPSDISFKLNFKANEIHTCLISKASDNPITLTQEQLHLLLRYHLKVLCLCHGPSIDFNNLEVLNEYFKRITSLSDEKKFLIAPLIESSPSLYEIHWSGIKKLLDDSSFQNELNLEERCSRFLNAFQSQSDFTAKARNKLYYRPSKPSHYYEIIDIIYFNDDGEAFLTKIAQYDSNYRSQLIEKSFEGKAEVLKLSTREIMEKSPTSMHCVNTFRAVSKAINPIAYVYGRLCTFNGTLSPYRKGKTSKQVKGHLYSLLPIETLYSTHLSLAAYEIIRNLSSICISLEESVIPFSLLKYISPQLQSELSLANMRYFQWACSAPSLLQDYDYETLETVGDSILKLVITMHLYYNDSVKAPSKRMSMGMLERKLSSLVNNKVLMKKAKKGRLYQYLLAKPFNKDEWMFPLKSQSLQCYHQDISSKAMADFVEAAIGACYLFKANIFDSINFIKQAKLLSLKPEEQNAFETFLNDKVKGLSVEGMCSSFVEMSEEVTFSEVMQLSNLNYSPIHSFSQLEQSIGYSFCNKQLLYQAFTHRNMVNSIEDSYEKLELLGDALVETFILLAIMAIFKNLIHPLPSHFFQWPLTSSLSPKAMDNIKANADYISCSSLTYIKSFLCANSFMCKIGAYFSFHRLLLIESDDIVNEPLKAFSTEDNLSQLINQRLNEYSSARATQPKFIADAFEALIAAVFIDSDIIRCFEVLALIYGPFIHYCALYMKDIKYSVISDFVNVCVEKTKQHPKFIPYMNSSDNMDASSAETGNDSGEEEFLVDVVIGEEVLCVGRGKTVESAKQNGAEEGLNKLIKLYH